MRGEVLHHLSYSSVVVYMERKKHATDVLKCTALQTHRMPMLAGGDSGVNGETPPPRFHVEREGAVLDRRRWT
jgi:hypothetical protein